MNPPCYNQTTAAVGGGYPGPTTAGPVQQVPSIVELTERTLGSLAECIVNAEGILSGLEPPQPPTACSQPQPPGIGNVFGAVDMIHARSEQLNRLLIRIRSRLTGG